MNSLPASDFAELVTPVHSGSEYGSLLQAFPLTRPNVVEIIFIRRERERQKHREKDREGEGVT